MHSKTFDTSGQLVDGIDFSAMDDFMNHVIMTVQKEGTTIARVFPPDSDALLYFTDRIANDVVGDFLNAIETSVYGSPDESPGGDGLLDIRLHPPLAKRGAQPYEPSLPPHDSSYVRSASAPGNDGVLHRAEADQCDARFSLSSSVRHVPALH